MSLIKCAKCGVDDEVVKCHLHHLVPKQIGGKDTDGRKYICEPCHVKLHIMIRDWIKEFHNETKRRTINWINIK